MSIPARRDDDDDLVICGVLREVRASLVIAEAMARAWEADPDQHDVVALMDAAVAEWRQLHPLNAERSNRRDDTDNLNQ